MKKIYQLALISAITLGSFNYSNASDVAGAEMTYKNIGQNTFVFTIKRYRDCSGVSILIPPAASLYFKGSCNPTGVWSDIIALNPTKSITVYDSTGFLLDISTYTQTEISQLCPSAVSACGGGAYPGREVYTFQDTIILTSCGDWNIEYSPINNRNMSNNLINTYNHYFYCTSFLNSLQSPNNNSPTFTATPFPYVCVNQKTTYNLGVVETDGDSLHYSFISAMTMNGTNITYNSPYSYDYPIDSVTINSNTGEIEFTPTAIGNYVLVVKVEEFDENDSLIGTVMRDFQVVVNNCSTNQQPYDTSGTIQNLTTTGTQTGNRSLMLDAGSSFSFDVAISDTNATDTLTLTSNVTSVLQGATFTTTDGNPATATITWNAIWNTPRFNTFTISANDGACPIPGMQYYTYEVVSNNQGANPTITIPDDSSIYNISDTTSYTFTAADTGGVWSGNGIVDSINGSFRADIAGLGTHTIVYTISNNADSINVIVTSSSDATINPAGPFCLSDPPDTLTAVTSGGTWLGTGITDTSLGTFNPAIAGTGIHQIIYTISGTYGDADTVSIIVNSNFDATITLAGPFCKSDATVTLTAADGGGVWSGVGIADTINGTFDPAVAGAGTHIISYSISGACGDSDSMAIIVVDSPVTTITTTGESCQGMCDGTGTAVVLGGSSPYTYLWNDTQTSSTAIGLCAGVYSVTVIDNIGCTDSSNSTVFSNPSPIANFSIDPYPAFIPNSIISFTDTSTGSLNTWNWTFYDVDGSTVIDISSIMNPVFQYPSVVGTYPVLLQVIDIYGCMDDTTKFVLIDKENNINEYNFGFTFEVYPNPTNGDITIEILIDEQQITNYEVKVFNILGQTVYHQTLNTKQKTLNLSSSPSGLYNVQVISEKGVYMNKIVKY